MICLNAVMLDHLFVCAVLIVIKYFMYLHADILIPSQEVNVTNLPGELTLNSNKKQARTRQAMPLLHDVHLNTLTQNNNHQALCGCFRNEVNLVDTVVDQS